jgi:pimeloyl-ACP methyl ester carboxylesterase
MAKDIVMLHGANVGAWCFEAFKTVFQEVGWTCHAPDLIGHGSRSGDAAETLIGVGIADYLAELEGFLKTIGSQPVLLGHSMGAVLAQRLAARRLARALILVAPAPCAGIVPHSESEKKLARDLMGLGAFWNRVIDPDFELACFYSLNRVPEHQQRAVFDRFGPESGRAFFELLFWMFDSTGATVVDTKAVTCPVLCLAGRDDNLVSIATARASAAGYRGATFLELEGHGHMLVLEPGAEKIARRIADWLG